MDIKELKEQSDIIAKCDDDIRDIEEKIKNLNDLKNTLLSKKTMMVYKLQDNIDSMFEKDIK